ncbi:MAG: restriction endonuclease subunit S, partial [Planctomycetaceae bacterium]|nr:restriction endonuclease subunit S [Planctomycetaceae bacterium]
MSKTVSFADLFKRVKRPIDLPDHGEHPLVGIRLNGNGAFLRELKPGLSIKKKRHYVLAKGDIAYNKLFAWRGSFAVVGDDVDACFVSDKFPTYTLRSDMVTPEYLRLVFRSESLAKQAELRSVGSAAMSKFTLNPPRFLELRCEVPSRQTQLQLVSIAERLDSAIQAAAESAELIRIITAAFVGRFVQSACSKYSSVPLGEIGDLERRSVVIQDERVYRQVTIGMNNRGVRLRGEKPGYQIAVKNQAVVRSGDVVFSRIDIRNGAIGLVPDELDGAVVANDFPVYVAADSVDLRFLELMFRTPEFREQCQNRSAGSTNRKKMKRAVFLELRVPLPPKTVQQQIVSVADEITASIGELESSAERVVPHSHAVMRKLLNEL